MQQGLPLAKALDEIAVRAEVAPESYEVMLAVLNTLVTVRGVVSACSDYGRRPERRAERLERDGVRRDLLLTKLLQLLVLAFYLIKPWLNEVAVVGKGQRRASRRSRGPRTCT